MPRTPACWTSRRRASYVSSRSMPTISVPIAAGIPMSSSMSQPKRLAAQTASCHRPVASHVDSGTRENKAAIPRQNSRKDFTCIRIA